MLDCRCLVLCSTLSVQFILAQLAMENIWTAASSGHLDRVRELVESGQHSSIRLIPLERLQQEPDTHSQTGTSPNALDENSYSPLHAAASWGHADILRYLVDRGGHINLTDSDNETPLYVVENVAIAKLVVELGGDPNWTNEEGLTVSCSFSHAGTRPRPRPPPDCFCRPPAHFRSPPLHSKKSTRTSRSTCAP